MRFKKTMEMTRVVAPETETEMEMEKMGMSIGDIRKQRGGCTL